MPVNKDRTSNHSGARLALRVKVSILFSIFDPSPGGASCRHRFRMEPFGGLTPPIKPLNVECQTGKQWVSFLEYGVPQLWI